jgi:hypothetical protein
MKFTGRNLTTFAILSLLSLFIGCGGGGGGSSGSGSAATGTLSLSLQDATSESYRAVYVTIDRVEVHMGGDEGADSNWTNVLSSDKAGRTYNLLELVNGVREELGIVDLPAGPYTQMRLIIGREPDNGINVLSQSHPYANYVITEPGLEVYELKVPSGFQTGLKIVHGFDVSENQTTELILDFDASKSVVKAGNSGKWLLKPTVKVFRLEEYAIVRGTVTVAEGGPRVGGVLVSAQQIDNNGNPLVYTATVTEEDGSYALFLDPDRDGDGVDDHYTIVAYKKGYDAGCSEVITSAEMNQAPGTTSVTLAGPKATGTLTGNVTISGGSADQYVTLSFRQEKNCTSAVSPPDTQPVYVEVTTVNFVNNDDYSTGLTVGTYDVNASTYDAENDQLLEYEAGPVTIAEDGNTPPLDISF